MTEKGKELHERHHVARTCRNCVYWEDTDFARTTPTWKTCMLAPLMIGKADGIGFDPESPRRLFTGPEFCCVKQKPIDAEPPIVE
jgi:hypothetical protein